MLNPTNTAAVREFNTRTAFSYTTSRLSGCTALIIVSRRAVYVAHYWETLSFSLNEDGSRYGSTDDEAFQNGVINGLRDGEGGQQQSLAVVGRTSWFRNTDGSNPTRAYLMIPTKGPDGTPDPYRAYWNRLKDTVNELVPELQNAGGWTEITYEGLHEDDIRLRDTAAGKLVFKYDPKHQFAGDDRKWRVTRLWAEGEFQPYHSDQW